MVGIDLDSINNESIYKELKWPPTLKISWQ